MINLIVVHKLFIFQTAAIECCLSVVVTLPSSARAEGRGERPSCTVLVRSIMECVLPLYTSIIYSSDQSDEALSSSIYTPVINVVRLFLLVS